MNIVVKHVYDGPGHDDGTRVLVDRIWPRGLRKSDAHLDYWLKDVAPSTELRKWYGHDPEKFREFADRYRHELNTTEGQDALQQLRDAATGKKMTLLTATKDIDHSQAAVLAELLGD
ncbi:DUF488 family protein [Brevibacterium daeguense]|uniref:DUF488 family protein n=1 Tax=Brevibacterium daeguense TaxID=909936 RepID=A0ABP8EJ89_9MICO|nr:DUF488 family protein [Brevibacterium daeguense]